MVCQGHLLCAIFLRQVLWQLRSESKMMYNVREHMTAFYRCIKVVIEIMYVHVAIAETPARCDMEVANDLVDSKASLYPTPLSPLRIQPLSIMFALALLDILTTPESPRGSGVRLPNFITGIATAWFLRIGRRIRTIASAAVGWIKMCCLVIHGVPM
jgi:branched-subunit amino acid transport protein